MFYNIRLVMRFQYSPFCISKSPFWRQIKETTLISIRSNLLQLKTIIYTKPNNLFSHLYVTNISKINKALLGNTKYQYSHYKMANIIFYIRNNLPRRFREFCRHQRRNPTPWLAYLYLHNLTTFNPITPANDIFLSLSFHTV